MLVFVQNIDITKKWKGKIRTLLYEAIDFGGENATMNQSRFRGGEEPLHKWGGGKKEKGDQ
jgi:hypothetical protein